MIGLKRLMHVGKAIVCVVCARVCVICLWVFMHIQTYVWMQVFAATTRGH